MSMLIPQTMSEQETNKQNNNLWIIVPDNNIRIGERQEFNDYELIQEEYLRNMERRRQTEKPHYQIMQIIRISIKQKTMTIYKTKQKQSE